MPEKDVMERICRAAGMRPEKRTRHGDYEIFIADGFSLPPHKAYRRFGIEPEDFPMGMYCTLWWTGMSERLDTGQPLFFDAFHDNQYDQATRKAARINRALKEAQGFLERRKRLQ